MAELILSKEIVVNKSASRVIGVMAFVILTALGAFVRLPLPFTPVPITLQTFFVLLSGAFLGSRLGAASQLGYILLGIAGLPIFTNAGSGLFYLFGPTGGYIFGFILAGYFIGRFIKYRQKNFISLFCLFCLADFLLLLSGVVWLKVIFGYRLSRLFLIGFIPFLPGDLIKAWAASFIYWKLKARIKEVF